VLTGLICINLLLEKPQYSWPGLVIVALGIPVYFGWRAMIGEGGRGKGEG